MAEKAMSLDDEVQVEPQVDESKSEQGNDSQADPKPRQGDQNRPYCRVHFCLMTATSTSKGVTRYKCPVADCDEGEKRAQPRSVIPREPMQCPWCRQRAIEVGVKKVKPVYCVVDYRHSQSAMLRMVCPDDECGFRVLVPRPDVSVRAMRERNRQEDISA